VLGAVGAAAVLLAATACSALGGSDAPPDGGGQPGALEKTDVSVGVLPIVDVAALQRAKSAGYFDQEGLNVTLQNTDNGAAALAGVVSGDLDLAWVNWGAAIQAEQKGVAEMRVINATYEAAPNSFMLLTRPNSGITKPQDVVGKKLAINGQGSLTELLTRSALQANGVDPNSVTYVVIPFPDLNNALQNGQVDAITVLEPFLTAAETSGAVTVMDVASGPTDKFPVAGVATTKKFVDANPNTVAAFTRAVGKAQAEMSDRSIVEQTLTTYTKITPETAPLLHLGTWPTTVDATRIQRVADLMTQFGQLPGHFDVTPLLEDIQG
jgi:NitT/TauT family transport system substrate-binding protein